jgi:hypothetical protein
VRSLREVGFNTPVDLLATHDGRGSDLTAWLTDAEPEATPIYDSILEHRRPLAELFTGSPEIFQDLSQAMGRRRPRTLSNAEAVEIAKSLASAPSRRISISWSIGDDEALQYATALRQAITAGGWRIVRARQSEFSQRVTGLLIFVGTDPPPAEANELFQALRAAGLTVEGNVDPSANPGSVVLVVGAHQ